MSTDTGSTYAIAQGEQGASRLEVLTRLTWSSSARFLQKQGCLDGMHCLELGCGAGAVSQVLLALLGDKGRLTGFDIDSESIALAKKNVNEPAANFTVMDLEKDSLPSEPVYDLIYCRLILEHLSDPMAVISRLNKQLKPGGVFVVQDADCHDFLHWPENAAYQQYAKLLTALIKKQGGCPQLGRQLPSIFRRSGFTDINFEVEHPIYVEGEGKQFPIMTLEAIREGLLKEKLLSEKEYSVLLDKLSQFCSDPDSLVGIVRFVHCAGRKPC